MFKLLHAANVRAPRLKAAERPKSERRVLFKVKSTGSAVGSAHLHKQRDKFTVLILFILLKKGGKKEIHIHFFKKGKIEKLKKKLSRSLRADAAKADIYRKHTPHDKMQQRC